MTEKYSDDGTRRVMSGTTCTPGAHYVAEGWEELNMGICPRCGTAVYWNETSETWDPDTNIRVLLLEQLETDLLRRFLASPEGRRAIYTSLRHALAEQLDLQET